MDESKEKVQKKDFVEIKYTGYEGERLFDSNIEEDLKKINSEEKPRKTIVCVGQGMIVKGLDNALEGKEIGKDYEIEVSPKEGFGERDRTLIKTIPLKVFVEKNIQPKPGLILAMDNSLVKIITVSGARVITDFNSPLAGKVLKYKLKIVRKVEDEKEKCDSLFDFFFRFVPEYEIKDKVIVKGIKALEVYVKAFNDKFKEMIGKELGFELKVPEPEKKTENKKQEEVKENNSN